MKFKNYLKLGALYYFLSGVVSVFFFVLFIIELPSARRSYTAYTGSVSGTNVSPEFYFIAHCMGTFQYFIKLLIVTQIAFFIFKNFKVVYGNIKKVLG